MTLIELLITIVIAGILLMIAVPSFVSLTQTNRLAGEANALSGDLQFARAEAIKEGLPVSICVSTNGTSCASASTPWQSGWMVFPDNANLSGTSPPTATGVTPLRRQTAWTSTDTFTASNSGGSISSITFNRDGMAIGLTGPVTWTLRTSPINATATRCVYLDIAGHQQVLRNGQATATGTCS